MISPLPNSEWNFAETQISDSEGEACLYYEYGREAEAFKKRVAAWREQNPKLLGLARELLLVDPSMLEKAAPFMAHPPAPDTIPRDEMEVAVWRLSIILRIWFSQTFPIQGAGDFELAHPDGTWNSQHAFLYRFPPFPDTPWLELDKSIRENALKFFWKPRRLNKSPDMSEAIKRQQEMQVLAKMPLNEDALKANISDHGDFFVSAPPLREGALINGAPPPGSRLEKENTQLWMGDDYCHEQIHLVVNWAKGNDEIKRAFVKWLGTHKKGRRPCKSFEHWKGTTSLELLKQLGAYRIRKAGISAKQACKDYPLFGSRGAIQPDERTEVENQFRKAGRKAEKLLEKLFPSSGL